MAKGLSRKESGYKSRLEKAKKSNNVTDVSGGKVAGRREWSIMSNATKRSNRMKSAYLIYKNTNDFSDGSF